MTGADALRALADGKPVRRAQWSPKDYVVVNKCGSLVDEHGGPWAPEGLDHSDWSVVEEPATDAELVAEMRRLADACWNSPTAKDLVSKCATMLEKRSIRP